jgi:hypothetical protein
VLAPLQLVLVDAHRDAKDAIKVGQC